MLPDGFLDDARRLIAADSVSANGNRAAIDVLLPLFARAGLDTEQDTWHESIDGAPEATHTNVLAGPGGRGAWSTNANAERGAIVLVTHTDTVPAGPRERWTETGGDPWALTERDGVLYGLGVADVKLDLLCKIEAARRLRDTTLARPFFICGTAAEEVGLRGALRFARSSRFHELAPSAVLCGEPCELKLIRAHKGYAVVRVSIVDRRAPQFSGGPIEEISFAGKAAHSSTPQLGRNAIDLACAAFPGSAGTEVLDISGGVAANVVPAQCTVTVASRRALPERWAPAPDLRPTLARAHEVAQLWNRLVGELAPRTDPHFSPEIAVSGWNIARTEKRGDGLKVLHATFDARLLPDHDPDVLLARFAEQARSDSRFEILVRIDRNAGGMALDEASPLVQTVSRTLTNLGLDGRPTAKPTSTEAGVFVRAGVPSIVLGPGVSTGNAHTANERIEVAQLDKAINLYVAVLRDLCGAV